MHIYSALLYVRTSSFGFWTIISTLSSSFTHIFKVSMYQDSHILRYWRLVFQHELWGVPLFLPTGPVHTLSAVFPCFIPSLPPPSQTLIHFLLLALLKLILLSSHLLSVSYAACLLCLWLQTQQYEGTNAWVNYIEAFVLFRSLFYNKDTSWGGWKFNGVWSNLLVARCRTVELAAKNFDSLAKSPGPGSSHIL